MITAVGVLVMVFGGVLLYSAVTQSTPIAYIRDEILAILRGGDG